MARKLKFREPTDVVSVRLPLSLIDRLDSICQKMRIRRGEFFVAVLRDYPNAPNPKHIRIWLANLTWVLVGGGTALLAAVHGGSEPIAEWMAPARTLTREPMQYEYSAPSFPSGPLAAPVLPPRDLRLDKAWRLGNLQALIPREPAVDVSTELVQPKEEGRNDTQLESGRRP